MTEVLPPAVHPDNLPLKEVKHTAFLVMADLKDTKRILTVDASPIDRGGFGIIYRAADSTGIMYALKSVDRSLFKRWYSTSPNEAGNAWIQAQTQLEREANIINSMNHPNIVRGKGIAIRRFKMDPVSPEETLFNEQIFAVFEMLDPARWENLRKKRETGYQFSYKGTLSILDQSIQGLIHARDAHAPQRDVKPDNILIHSNPDETYNVKHIDWGITELVREPAAFVNPKLANNDELVRSPGYTPLERILENSNSQQEPIYSLGIIGAEMLLGKQIIQNKKDEDEIFIEFLSSKTSEVSRRINEYMKEQNFSPEVRQVFIQATEIPENRYKTLEEFRFALSEIQYLQPVISSPLPDTGDTQIISSLAETVSPLQDKRNAVQRLISRLRKR